MFRNCFIVFSCFLLSACSGFLPAPYDLPDGPQPPYTIRGITYHPIGSAEDFHEIGIASWYGPDFHGKLTANGEVYNQHLYTAAHKTLPLGSYIYVENLENGEVCRVRINDRGPFVEGRVIDLSRKAAIDLGILDQGIARVRLYDHRTTRNEAIEAEEAGQTYSSQASQPSQSSASSSASASISQPQSSGYSVPTGGSTYIDVGTYNSRSEADEAAELIATLGLPYRIVSQWGNYSIESGPYVDTQDAQNKIAILQFKFPQAHVR